MSAHTRVSVTGARWPGVGRPVPATPDQTLPAMTKGQHGEVGEGTPCPQTEGRDSRASDQGLAIGRPSSRAPATLKGPGLPHFPAGGASPFAPDAQPRVQPRGPHLPRGQHTSEVALSFSPWTQSGEPVDTGLTGGGSLSTSCSEGGVRTLGTAARSHGAPTTAAGGWVLPSPAVGLCACFVPQGHHCHR